MRASRRARRVRARRSRRASGRCASRGARTGAAARAPASAPRSDRPRCPADARRRPAAARSRNSASSSSLVTRSSSGRRARASWSPRMRTYSSGSGVLRTPGRDPVAHLAAAHEIGHELEALAVPGVEERARRRLAIQLLDRDGAGAAALAAARATLDFRLEDAGRPQHAHDVGARRDAQAEQRCRRERARAWPT